MTCAIIVHGGAKELTPSEIAPHKEGCTAAIEAGWKILAQDGHALDAVEAAVRVMEADPTFNAGLGSALNSDGEVEMDAAIMDGTTLKAGAVATLRSVRQTISVARKLMESGRAVMLAGEGAYRFASENCQELCTSESMITEAQRAAWLAHPTTAQPVGADTVGCVALDSDGNIACATSTGGLMGKLPGRIGDSPLVGCGLYADDLGGTALTGDGESIIRVALASRIIALLHTGTAPDEIADAAIRYFKDHVPGEAGCIILDRQGRVGWAHNSPNMAGAYFSTGMQRPVAFVKKESSHA